MSYGNVDDQTHFKAKVRNASWACRGVIFSAALPYCAVSQTDGVLHPDFVRDHVKGRDGRRAWIEATERGFVHRAGELCARCELRLREELTDPLPAEGDFYLHDYLEHNPSKREINERRRGARERQAAKRNRDRQSSLPWSEPSVSRVSHAPPPPGVEGEPTESNEERGRFSRAPAPGVVGEVMEILRRCERLAVPDHCEVGIESAIAGNPGKDPIAAAHASVSRATDPAWRTTWGPTVFGGELQRQEAASPAAGRSKQQREADDLAALHRLAGGAL